MSRAWGPWARSAGVVMLSAGALAFGAPGVDPDGPSRPAPGGSAASSGVLATGDLKTTLRTLGELERLLADKTASPQAQRDARAQADAARARLIELAPGDDRAPTWLVDRAAHSLATLSDDGADLSLLVGLATQEQRRRGARASAAALGFLDRAKSAAGVAIAKLEGDVVGRAGLSGAAEKELARLVDVEQSQRIPFFSGLAGVIQSASLANEAERSASAATAIKALDGVRLRTPAIEAAKDALAGLALLNAGTALSDRARATIRTRLEAALGNPAAEPGTRTRARLGLAVIGVHALEPIGSAAPWPDRLIDAEARVRATVGGGGGARRLESISGPVGEMLRLGAEPAADDATSDARRALVYAKLAPLIDPRAGATTLAPELALARAVALLRDDADPRSVGAAQALLTGVADRSDAPPALRADALWELAASWDRQTGADARSRQTQALSRLVQELSETRRAVSAARIIVDRSGPDWPAIIEGRGPTRGVSAEYTGAVRLLVERAGDGPLRCELVRSTLFMARPGPGAGKGGKAGITLGGLTEAIALSGPGGKCVPEGAATLMNLLRRVAPALGDAPASDRDAMVQSALNFARSIDPAQADALTLEFAQARLDLGEHESAVLLFRTAMGSGVDVPASAAAARIRLGLAKALRARREIEPAFTTLRELAEQFEKAPGETGREEAYWTAWCEMLDLLVSVDGAAGSAESVLTFIKRLELIDPELGSGRSKSKLESLRAAALSARPAPAATAPGGEGKP